MIDTVELALPKECQFSPEVDELLEELRAPEPQIRFMRNKYFKAVIDLREYTQHEAVLKLHGRNGGNHVLQMIEAGTKVRGQITDTVRSIVADRHPEMLGTSRVDLCANVEGTGVAWFARSVRSRSAQWQAALGHVELEDSDGRRMQFSEMGKRQLQTIYMGKQPNCVRIYDKVAERQSAYRKERLRHERIAAEGLAEKVVGAPWATADRDWQRGMVQRLKPAGRNMAPFPSFEDWWAGQCTGGMSNVVQMQLPGQEQAEQLSLALPKVLTRVERQMGAGRVPRPIGTFERLWSNALEFNPFDKLQFNPADAEPVFEAEDFSPVEVAAGLQFRQWLSSGELTYQQLFAFLNMKGNGARTVRRFRPFLAIHDERSTGITPAELYESYRDTVSRQLAA